MMMLPSAEQPDPKSDVLDMRVLAAAVFLSYGDTLVYKFGASDAKTLNFRPNVPYALAYLRRGRSHPGEDYAALLDRLDLDVFLGIRLADQQHRYRATTLHLERAPGWLPVFRNLESAV